MIAKKNHSRLQTSTSLVALSLALLMFTPSQGWSMDIFMRQQGFTEAQQDAAKKVIERKAPGVEAKAYTETIGRFENSLPPPIRQELSTQEIITLNDSAKSRGVDVSSSTITPAETVFVLTLPKNYTSPEIADIFFNAVQANPAAYTGKTKDQVQQDAHLAASWLTEIRRVPGHTNFGNLAADQATVIALLGHAHKNDLLPAAVLAYADLNTGGTHAAWCVTAGAPTADELNAYGKAVAVGATPTTQQELQALVAASAFLPTKDWTADQVQQIKELVTAAAAAGGVTQATWDLYQAARPFTGGAISPAEFAQLEGYHLATSGKKVSSLADWTEMADFNTAVGGSGNMNVNNYEIFDAAYKAAGVPPTAAEFTVLSNYNTTAGALATGGDVADVIAMGTLGGITLDADHLAAYKAVKAVSSGTAPTVDEVNTLVAVTAAPPTGARANDELVADVKQAVALAGPATLTAARFQDYITYANTAGKQVAGMDAADQRLLARIVGNLGGLAEAQAIPAGFKLAGLTARTGGAAAIDATNMTADQILATRNNPALTTQDQIVGAAAMHTAAPALVGLSPEQVDQFNGVNAGAAAVTVAAGAAAALGATTDLTTVHKDDVIAAYNAFTTGGTAIPVNQITPNMIALWLNPIEAAATTALNASTTGTHANIDTARATYTGTVNDANLTTVRNAIIQDCGTGLRF